MSHISGKIHKQVAMLDGPFFFCASGGIFDALVSCVSFMLIYRFYLSTVRADGVALLYIPRLLYDPSMSASTAAKEIDIWLNISYGSVIIIGGCTSCAGCC